jgi:putative nucleotidyltransferase with HDIG domain
MAMTRFLDLPRRTQWYVLAVVLAGAATVGHSVAALYQHPIGWTWTILAALTLVSGSATVNLPGLPATVSVSETFVFTSVLLFGSAAGTLTVALDALVISFWSFRRGHAHYKILFNVCAVPLTLWTASHLYYSLSPYGPLYLYGQPVKISLLLLPLLTFTIAYYCINTWVITVAIALERQLSALKVWRENFVWIALNYFGGASVAALLVSYTRDLDYTFLLIIVPLLVVLYFTFSTSMGRVEDSNRHLSELNRLYMSTIETLAMAIDAKDQITHGHIRRVQVYAVGLAKAMGVTDESQLRAIEAAALLHDMGKLAVPEYILNKPGPLTPAEFEKMKLHASVGADILSAIEFPYPVVPIVRHHHENWNGTGYPDGISGADIPIGARILSVVDCFDALTSDRPYRPRLTEKDALKILAERRGTMYDPLVVDVFGRVYAHIAPTEQPASAIQHAMVFPPSGVALNETAKRSLDEIAAGTDEMLTLFGLARALRPDMGVGDIADAAEQHLRRLVPASLSAFFLLDAKSDDLIAVHSAGTHSSSLSGLRIQRGHRLSGWVAANRQTIRNSDPVLDFGESVRAMDPRLRSALSTPLVADDELVGVLTVYSTAKEAFGADHERIIESVARQIAFPIKQASLRANTDAAAQSSFIGDVNSISPQIVATPAALLLIHIRRITESIDADMVSTARVADRLAQVAIASLRPADRVLRYGADSLVVFLPHTTDRSADVLQNRLLASLSAEPALSSNWSVQITVATSPPEGRSLSELFEVARRRMAALPSGRADDSSSLIH